MTIREVAEDFVSKANPFFLSKAKEPKTITYEIDGYPDVEFDLILEYDGDDFHWYYGVVAYDKVSGDRADGHWVYALPNHNHVREVKNMLTKYCKQVV